MRGWIFVVWAAGLTAWAQQTNLAPQPSPTNASTASQPADPFAGLTATWLHQRDPKLRLQAAQVLVDAAIHDQTGTDDTSVVENVARDDKPAHVIDPPAAQKIILHPVFDLGFTCDATPPDKQTRPVFRRVANHRLEVWIPNEGWLFGAKGELLTHVTVPRKDGAGREWYGAFLPDGTWVTTDLWEHDKELNCFDAHGKMEMDAEGRQIEGRSAYDPRRYLSRSGHQYLQLGAGNQGRPALAGVSRRGLELR